MSDDLISRKALMEGRVENDPIRIAAMCADTVFDKEKVIEDLQEAGQSCNEANDICGAEAIEYAIEIVEKGGIE